MTLHAACRASALGLLLLAGCANMPAQDSRPLFKLDGAAAADPSSPMELGKSYFAAGRYGLALETFGKVLAAEPASVRAMNAIAASFDQLGRFDLADRYYGRALEIEPNSVEVLNNLGYSHLLRHDFAGAQKFLAMAKAVDAGNGVVGANMTLANAEQDRALHEAGAILADPRRGDLAASATAQAVDPAPGLQIVRLARGVQALITRPQVAADPAPVRQPAAGAAPAELGDLAFLPAEPQQPATPSPIRPVSLAVPDRRWSIEVANGAGRTAMAARLRGYLADKGVHVAHLTNDASFGHRRSTITYRPGAAAAAAALAGLFPVEIGIAPRDGQRTDVRLLLGADLLEFDTNLNHDRGI